MQFPSNQLFLHSNSNWGTNSIWSLGWNHTVIIFFSIPIMSAVPSINIKIKVFSQSIIKILILSVVIIGRFSRIIGSHENSQDLLRNYESRNIKRLGKFILISQWRTYLQVGLSPHFFPKMDDYLKIVLQYCFLTFLTFLCNFFLYFLR